MLMDDSGLEVPVCWKHLVLVVRNVHGWHLLLCCYVTEIVYLQSEVGLYDLCVS